MIKHIVKTLTIAGVLVSMTGCITIQTGAQQRQAQPQAYSQPINYGGAQQQGQQQGAVRCKSGGTQPSVPACQQQDAAAQQPRFSPQQQGQQQQSGCSSGYRNLTTGKWKPTC